VLVALNWPGSLMLVDIVNIILVHKCKEFFDYYHVSSCYFSASSLVAVVMCRFLIQAYAASWY
jgi:hypothetical protein